MAGGLAVMEVGGGYALTPLSSGMVSARQGAKLCSIVVGGPGCGGFSRSSVASYLPRSVCPGLLEIATVIGPGLLIAALVAGEGRRAARRDEPRALSFAG
jgi:hypothetical protein